MADKKDIRTLDKLALQAYFEGIGEPGFRAQQTYEWLWQKGARDFSDMTNLSINLRERLAQDFVINHIEVDQLQRSSDGTIKNAVRLFDGKVVESVLIPTDDRITACVSSQVGCSLDCSFCATASLKRMRNLNPDEIYDQVVTIQQEAEEFFGRPLTNIVFMGMGEPLMNYKNVLTAVEKITSAEGLNISPRRITLSTVGLSKMIQKLADDEVRFNLALSLHSARDEVRSQIMNINKANPLSTLKEALRYWHEKTDKGVTYEYVVWRGVNDRPEDIKALLHFCELIPCKVNLIEYNPVPGIPYEQASAEAVENYQKALGRAGITSTIRRSRGKDIDAACGQLANRNEISV